MDTHHAPTALDEIDGEPIEQLGVGRRRPFTAEVEDGRDQRPAEVPRPDVIDRDAGRETMFMPGRAPFRLPPRDPVLYFVQRMRDEAHRFAIGSHRRRRSTGLREGGLQEIPGVGPARKRALLRYFGTLKAIERASISDLAQAPGVSAGTARKIYGYFHESAAESERAVRQAPMASGG